MAADTLSSGFEFGGGNTALDPAVLAHLPSGCRVVVTHRYGSSFWGACGRIDLDLPSPTTTTTTSPTTTTTTTTNDPFPRSLFIKTTTNPLAPAMFASETASAHAIRAVVPDLVPRPIAWGAYISSPSAYFYLAEFRPMATSPSPDLPSPLPDPDRFAEKIAALHRDSIGASTNTKGRPRFGFETTTYNGTLPHDNGWEDSWQVFFAKSLRRALDHEADAKGRSNEVDELARVVFEKVVPRLLGPLESEGRTVKPALVHGDLWYGNAGTHAETGEPFVFDACCFYAHNEYELGQWKPACNRFGKEYVEAYHRIIPKAEPVEDYDGRIDLYKLRFDTHVSALFVDNWGLREQVIGDMKDLIERYGQ